MEFTIQYFCAYDRLLYLEEVSAGALDHARMMIRECQPDGHPQPIGYVILDNRGLQVARRHRRDG